MQPQSRIGGSFAPPIDDNKLAAYRALAESCPQSPVRDGMLTLLACCEKWWALPEPSGNRTSAHPVGVGIIVHMSDEHKRELFDSIPWSKRSTGHDSELEAIGEAFDTIDPIKNRGLRNAAFHLLWFAHELDLDREPTTKDRL